MRCVCCVWQCRCQCVADRDMLALCCVQVLRERLLYAIYNCVEMDGDFRLTDSEMTGWE